MSRFIEDLTASDAAGWMSVISLHGGGSPEAMKREIYRRYPIYERKELVTRLMARGVLADAPAQSAEPGQCCEEGCAPTGPKPVSFVAKRAPRVED